MENKDHQTMNFQRNFPTYSINIPDIPPPTYQGSGRKGGAENWWSAKISGKSSC